MSNLDNIIRENSELKSELERMMGTVKENEEKHYGFKVVQYSFLLGETLGEFSSRSLKYLEEIFNLDKSCLFIRDGYYAVANGCTRIGERVFICSGETFDYTFLEKRIYYGNNKLMLHKNLRFPQYDGDFSFILAPVEENGKITAAIGLYSMDSERFVKEENFDFIKELALIVAIAMRKLNDAFMLEIQAQTDYLTGLPNKSMLEISADRWLERYRDYKKPFAFYLFDIDNFKAVNDTYGHLTGDDVLKRTAMVVRNVIDDGDLVGRFGGDEFYMFLDASDIERVSVLEKTILKYIRAIAEDMGLETMLGISGGGIRIPEDMDKANTFVELIKLADERLYQVKLSGKSNFNGVTNDYKKK